MCRIQPGLWHLPQQVSFLQTELTAILCALCHTTVNRNTTIIIIHPELLLTCKQRASDSSRLRTTVLHETDNLISLGKNIILDWLLSHIGLSGNKKADCAVAMAQSLPQITFPCAPQIVLHQEHGNPGCPLTHLTRTSGCPVSRHSLCLMAQHCHSPQASHAASQHHN